MNLKWYPCNERRTGRTTRILNEMLNSKYDRCIFISRTTDMAKVQMKMFEDIIFNTNESRCPCCLRFNIEINHSRMEVMIKGRVYRFMSKDRFYSESFKGLPQADIFKDHTIFE